MQVSVVKPRWAEIASDGEEEAVEEAAEGVAEGSNVAECSDASGALVENGEAASARITRKRKCGRTWRLRARRRRALASQLVESSDGPQSLEAVESADWRIPGWCVTGGMKMCGATCFVPLIRTFMCNSWLDLGRAAVHHAETGFDGAQLRDRDWVLSLRDGGCIRSYDRDRP